MIKEQRWPFLKKTVLLLLFLFVCICGFLSCQRIVSKKWAYPDDEESSAYAINEYYALHAPDEIDVFFLGTSHVLYGIDPMRIYTETGIVSFSLGTPNQTMETAFFLVQKVLEKSSPRIIYLDASTLFKSQDRYHSRIVADCTDVFGDKLRFASIYSSSNGFKNSDDFFSVVFPIVQYHERWKSMNKNDFNNFKPNYYGKGHLKNPQRNGAGKWAVRSLIDLTAKQMIDYNPNISLSNLYYLNKIHLLCESNGIRFELIKVPGGNTMQPSIVSWNRIKSQTVKNLSNQIGIKFTDFLYDYDVGLDWSEETGDYGQHLNYSGAEHFSSFLGNNLLQEQNIIPKEQAEYENDIPAWRSSCSVAELQSIQRLSEYLEYLPSLKGCTIIMSIYEDIRNHLSLEMIWRFRDLGLQTDFWHMKYGDSFVAIIKDGQVMFEKTTKGIIEKEMPVSDDVICSVVSKGLYADSESKIQIGTEDYSYSHPGINIVIYHDNSHQVIDSVNFNLSNSEDPYAIRNNSYSMFRRYEQWLMSNEYDGSIPYNSAARENQGETGSFLLDYFLIPSEKNAEIHFENSNADYYILQGCNLFVNGWINNLYLKPEQTCYLQMDDLIYELKWRERPDLNEKNKTEEIKGFSGTLDLSCLCPGYHPMSLLFVDKEKKQYSRYDTTSGCCIFSNFNSVSAGNYCFISVSMESKNARLYVDGDSLDNGANIKAGDSQNSILFSIVPVSGQYKIVNVNSKKVLDVTGMSSDRGANLQQYDFLNNDNQLWNIIQVEENKYYIQSALGTFVTFDPKSGNVFMNSYDHDNINQLWYLSSND